MHGENHVVSEDKMRRTAYHEAGHAVVSHYLNRKVAYVTIVSRGNHGGYMQNSEEEQGVYTKQDLLDMIKVCLAGRASEMIQYGNSDGLTSGISSDLKQATKIAKALICSYGMDDDIMMSISEEDLKNPFYSELIHKKVNTLLTDMMKETKEILERNSSKVRLLVDKLLIKNKLTQDEIARILR